MKISPRWLLSALGVSLFFLPFRAQARKHHHPSPTPAPLATPAAEPLPLPPEEMPRIDPAAPPSTSLQPFLDKHLGVILTPLGVSAFAQPELLASLKAAYADAMAAAPDAHKPAYQLAQGVCDAMTGALTERQNAVAALRGAVATHSSEAEQPRGGNEAVERARADNNFFIDGQRNNWIQRAVVLRQNISTLYLRERAVERRIGAWTPPSAVAAPTPSVAAPAPEADPVVGKWMLEGHSPLTLGPDHSVSGSRHGGWRYTCTTDGGRNYEVHWPRPKNWTDYLVLSSDGKRLDGKTRHNDHITYYRP